MNNSTAPVDYGRFKEFLGAVIRQIPGKIDPETLSYWINNQERLKWKLNFLSTRLELEVDTELPVKVNYSSSLEAELAKGEFNVNPSINSQNFPVTSRESGEIVIKLVSFNSDNHLEDVRRELPNWGYRGADPIEFLSLLNQYPKKTKRFSYIYALGQIWHSAHWPCVIQRTHSITQPRNKLEQTLELPAISSYCNAQARFAVMAK